MALLSPIPSHDPVPTLNLQEVTLCAVTSVNVHATLQALEVCLQQVRFGACKLLTNADIKPTNPVIEVVQITPLTSSSEYSNFVLEDLPQHVQTPHCLLAQWDGHVIDAGRWHAEFLNYDYIGASWPQFADGHNVGNGGFSLRSQRLMEQCRSTGFTRHHPEDVAIGRTNRIWLEEQGMRFAPQDMADMFSTERTGDIGRSFGYHGAFNMPQVLGARQFYEIYHGLDATGPVDLDFFPILTQVLRERPMLGLGLLLNRIARAVRKHMTAASDLSR
jgi:hypothetical protein